MYCVAIPDKGICIRWGGDEFLLIIPDCNYEESQILMEKIEKEQKIRKESMPYMEISMGSYVRYDIKQPEKEAIQQADRNMYADKAKRKAK